MIIKYKKENINSFLLIVFMFISSLTLPIKLLMGNGLIVWIATPTLIIVSLYINNWKIPRKINYIFFIISIIFILEILIVDYKAIVASTYIEFIKFGFISLYLSYMVSDYEKVLIYWYKVGIVNLFIWLTALSLVNAGEIDYMYLGVQLTYSFMIFAHSYYNNLFNKKINILLMITTIIPIGLLANRVSLVLCIAFLAYYEIKSMKRKNIIYVYGKVSIVIIAILYIFNNLVKILSNINIILNNIGINSYAINKYIYAINHGLVESSSGRDNLYSLSLGIIKNSYGMPRGIGYFTYITSEIYPHNIFLEVAITFGIIGILVLLILISYIVYYYIKVNDDSNKELVMLFGIFVAIRLNFSGTFWTEVPLWIIIGIIIKTSENKCELA